MHVVGDKGAQKQVKFDTSVVPQLSVQSEEEDSEAESNNSGTIEGDNLGDSSL